MNHALVVDDRIAVGRQRAAQGQVRVELAVLIEVDNAQRLGALDRALERREFPAQQAQQRGLAAAVGAGQANAHPRRDGEVRSSKTGGAS